MYFCGFCCEQIVNCETVKSVTLLNLVPRSHALVRTEKKSFLSNSFDRPTIQESLSKIGPTKPRNREIWQGYSRKKKTTGIQIRSRYNEKFTP